jgi:predicted PurR-regulated permease PerM
MLKAAENAAWIAAFAFVAAFVLGIVMNQSQPQSPKKQTQSEQSPQSDNNEAQPSINESTDQKPNKWAEHKKQIKEYWNSLIGFLESHDKLVSGIGSIFLVAFTALLAGSTLFLYLATRNLVEGAENTAQRQLRAYVGVGAEDLGFDTPSENDPSYTPSDPANPVAGRVFEDLRLK